MERMKRWLEYFLNSLLTLWVYNFNKTSLFSFFFLLHSHKYYLHKNVNNGKNVESGRGSTLGDCLLSEDMYVHTVLQLTTYNYRITPDMKRITFYVRGKSKPVMSPNARNIIRCFPCLKL